MANIEHFGRNIANFDPHMKIYYFTIKKHKHD